MSGPVISSCHLGLQSSFIHYPPLYGHSTLNVWTWIRHAWPSDQQLLFGPTVLIHPLSSTLWSPNTKCLDLDKTCPAQWSAVVIWDYSPHSSTILHSMVTQHQHVWTWIKVYAWPSDKQLLIVPTVLNPPLFGHLTSNLLDLDWYAWPSDEQLLLCLKR